MPYFLGLHTCQILKVDEDLAKDAPKMSKLPRLPKKSKVAKLLIQALDWKKNYTHTKKYMFTPRVKIL